LKTAGRGWFERNNIEVISIVWGLLGCIPRIYLSITMEKPELIAGSADMMVRSRFDKRLESLFQ